MAKKVSRVGRPRGRTTVPLSISAPQELLDQVQKIVDSDGSSTSRVVSDLLREGIRTRQSETAGIGLSDRIEVALDRLEARSVGFIDKMDWETSLFDYEAEAILISAALVPDDRPFQYLDYLSPAVFYSGWCTLHSSAWQELQRRKIELGPESYARLASLLAAYGVDLPEVAGKVTLDSYFERLQGCGLVARRYTENAAHRVLAAAIRRHHLGYGADITSVRLEHTDEIVHDLMQDLERTLSIFELKYKPEVAGRQRLGDLRPRPSPDGLETVPDPRTDPGLADLRKRIKEAWAEPLEAPLGIVGEEATKIGQTAAKARAPKWLVSFILNLPEE